MDSIGLSEFMSVRIYFIIGTVAITIIAMYFLRTGHNLKKENKIVLKIIIVLCAIVLLFNLFYLGRVVYLLNLYGI